MIILDEIVDFIKVIRIKMIAFYAKMSLQIQQRVPLYQRWSWRLCSRDAELVALTPRLYEILDFAPRLVGVGL